MVVDNKFKRIVMKGLVKPYNFREIVYWIDAKTGDLIAIDKTNPEYRKDLITRKAIKRAGLLEERKKRKNRLAERLNKKVKNLELKTDKKIKDAEKKAVTNIKKKTKVISKALIAKEKADKRLKELGL